MEYNFLNFTIQYFMQRRKTVFAFCLFTLVFLCAFLLYHLPIGAVLYPAFVCSAMGLALLLFDMRLIWKRHCCLQELGHLLPAMRKGFPAPVYVEEADYQQIIGKLCEEYRQLETEMDVRYSDMIDYYTVWAHQIKTPIASMHLYLRNQDSESARRIMEELTRIEQYVEMVLGYLRLDSDFTDYVIQEYDLDGIVKQAVKKFAGQFIRKKLRLNYQPLHTKVVTDEKWLQFVIEQIISNSLKYTESGMVTIEMENGSQEENPIKGLTAKGSVAEKEEAVLCIRDTGIGIAPEDLPRIFEKGYTGYNGRSDKKASGIGLYLCRRICGNLGHAITAYSSMESGTVIRIRFKR